MSEIADMLCISKVAVYKKLNKQLKNELTNHIKLVDGVKYITDEGLQVIKDSIDINLVNNQVYENKSTDDIDKSNLDDLTRLKDLQEDYINSLKDQLNLLKEQLKTKDIQLENKDRQLESKDELLKNFQILLKQQEQIQCENKKLMEYIAVTREEDNNKKGFFSKLFGK